jgi:hypothetical protein
MSDRNKQLAALDEGEEYSTEVKEEIYEAATDLADAKLTPLNSELEENSWEIAQRLVTEFRPVPSFLRSMLYKLFNENSSVDKLHHMVFFALHPLLMRAAKDETLRENSRTGVTVSDKDLSVQEALDSLGDDVAGALCFVHAVCRRVDHVLPKRISIPIVDDALIRAKLGFFLGMLSPGFGRGKGILAGFAGRSGLAIQIAAGDIEEVQGVLESLAVGEDIQVVGSRVYGCEPLQVSALSMIAAGCGRDSAFGVSTYGRRSSGFPADLAKERAKWFSAFCIVEHLRMGRSYLIEDSHWECLDITDAKKARLKSELQDLQRRGHRWRWLLMQAI